jgi:hypothetical protein
MLATDDTRAKLRAAAERFTHKLSEFGPRRISDASRTIG